MSALNTEFTERPAGWSLEKEGFTRVTRTDYFGKTYEVWEKTSPTTEYLWQQWRENKTWQGSGLIDEKKQQTLITIEREQL